MRISRRQLMPFGHGGGAVLFEGFAAVQVAVKVGMIVDRGVDGGEPQARGYGVRALYDQSERLVGLLGRLAVVQQRLRGDGYGCVWCRYDRRLENMVLRKVQKFVLREHARSLGSL